MRRRARAQIAAMWRPALGYGAMIAGGAVMLQWLDYQRLTRVHSDELYIGLIASGFLALGVWVGARVIGRRGAAIPFDGNPKAQASLGISAREMEVLAALVAGRANKEIARELNLSPNTVKTHVARLYEKLGARRRTDAVQRARELGLLP